MHELRRSPHIHIFASPALGNSKAYGTDSLCFTLQVFPPHPTPLFCSICCVKVELLEELMRCLGLHYGQLQHTDVIKLVPGMFWHTPQGLFSSSALCLSCVIYFSHVPLRMNSFFKLGTSNNFTCPLRKGSARFWKHCMKVSFCSVL